MRYVPAESLIEKRMGEHVLLHRKDAGDFVVFNRTGSEVWRWIGEQTPLDTICERFAAQYGEREDDLRAFLDKLERSGLVRRVNE